MPGACMHGNLFRRRKNGLFHSTSILEIKIPPSCVIAECIDLCNEQQGHDGGVLYISHPHGENSLSSYVIV